MSDWFLPSAGFCDRGSLGYRWTHNSIAFTIASPGTHDISFSAYRRPVQCPSTKLSHRTEIHEVDTQQLSWSFLGENSHSVVPRPPRFVGLCGGRPHGALCSLRYWHHPRKYLIHGVSKVRQSPRGQPGTNDKVF